MESTFNPTGEVLTLFYDLILSNAKSAENTLSKHNHLLAKRSLEEEVKKYASQTWQMRYQGEEVIVEAV